jgi:hypothetical protein
MANKKSSELKVAAVVVMLLSGCANEHAPKNWEIAPEALEGCRAPTTSECVTCCREEDEDFCYMSVGDEDWESIDAEPWDNRGAEEPGPCPEDCQPCASCSERDEQQLRELAPGKNRKCDCEHIEIGIDACFSDGCECYCMMEAQLEMACPRAD